MTALYHRFIQNAADLLRPLHRLLDRRPGKKRGKQLITWTEEAEVAFKRVKAALASAALLAHPVPGAPLSIAVDASDTGVGAVLQQHHHDAWQPLTYFSRSLTPTEARYSTLRTPARPWCLRTPVRPQRTRPPAPVLQARPPSQPLAKPSVWTTHGTLMRRPRRRKSSSLPPSRRQCGRGVFFCRRVRSV